MKKKIRKKHPRTERGALEALRDSAERLRLLISNAPVILWSMDATGVITRSEGKGLASLGLKAGQLVGKSVFDLYSHLPGAVETNRRALAGEEIHTLSQLGKRWLENRYAPVFDSKGVVTGVMESDSTDAPTARGAGG